MPEIITLQLGHYANFVGAHWWNMQEGSFSRTQSGFEKEINHDRLFHSGLTAKGEVTYTPRMVFVDLKGSLCHLRRDGALYEDEGTVAEEVSMTWDGQVVQEVSEATAKNPFLADLDAADEEYLSQQQLQQHQQPTSIAAQATGGVATTASSQQSSVPLADRLYDLDSDVNVWSDFLRPHFHPKSCCTVNDYDHNSDSNPFDIYSFGVDLMESGKIAEQFEDQVRFFAEACDRLEGYQLLTDIHNGFGGVGAGVIDHLRDFYEKKTIFTVATVPSSFDDMSAKKVACRSFGSALAFQHLSEFSSVMLPLSCSSAGLWPSHATQTAQSAYVKYKVGLNYHTSALLAATLDTISLPYRLRGAESSLHHMADLLTPCGRKVTSAYCALPLPFKPGQKLVDCLEAVPAVHEGDLALSLTPLVHGEELAYAQYATLRGIPPALAKQTEPGDLKPADAFRTYLAGKPSAMINSSCYVHEASVVAAPFPNIFPSSVTTRGFVETEESFLRPSSCGVHTMPVLATLQSRNSTYKLVEQIVRSADDAQPRRQFAFYQSTSSISPDTWSDTRESLMQLADNYSEM